MYVLIEKENSTRTVFCSRSPVEMRASTHLAEIRLEWGVFGPWCCIPKVSEVNAMCLKGPGYNPPAPQDLKVGEFERATEILRATMDGDLRL